MEGKRGGKPGATFRLDRGVSLCLRGSRSLSILGSSVAPARLHTRDCSITNWARSSTDFSSHCNIDRWKHCLRGGGEGGGRGGERGGEGGGGGGWRGEGVGGGGGGGGGGGADGGIRP